MAGPLPLSFPHQHPRKAWPWQLASSAFFCLSCYRCSWVQCLRIWVGYNPIALSAAAYVEQQQNAIRAFNTLLPVIGAVCVFLTAVLAIRARSEPGIRYLHVAAALCMVMAAVVTRFGNQPINAVVMTWSAQAPAASWTQLRDVWWQWHVVRSIAGIGDWRCSPSSRCSHPSE